MGRDKLTRDSDLYTSAIENRVISESNSETKITSMEGMTVSYNVHWTTNWKNLSKDGVERDCNTRYIERLRSMSPNKLSIELSGRGSNSRNWTAKMTVEPNVTVYITLSLPNGDTVSGRYNTTISDFGDVKNMHQLLRWTIEDYDMNAEINKETIELSKNKHKYTLFKNIASNSEVNKLYYHYILNGNRWMKCHIGEPEYRGKTVYFPINKNDDKLTSIQFDNADASDEFWKFANNYGYGDPIEVEGETIFFAIKRCTEHSNPNFISHPECVFKEEKQKSENTSVLHSFLSAIC